MKKLMKYLKPYWVFVVLAPALMMLEVAIDLFQPRLLEEIIDVGIMQNNLDVVVNTGLKMLLITFIGALGGIGCSVTSSIAAQNAGADIRRNLFSKVQHLSFGSIDRFGTGSLITRLTDDVVQFQHFIMLLLRMFVRAPLLFFGSVIMAFSISWRLSLIIVAIIPLIVIIIYFSMKKVLPLFTRVQKEVDKVNSVVRDNVSGIRVVKSFASSNQESAKFAKTNDEYMRLSMKAARILVVIMPLFSLILNFGIVAVIWIGGIQVEAGGLQTGQIMAFVNYLTRMLMSIMMIGMMLIFVSRAQASARRISEVLETPEEEDIDTTEKFDLDGAIEFQNVNFSYEGNERKVLHDINLTINPGETVAFLGDTGSGKSTLVNLIPRLYEVTSGRIMLNGIDITKIPRRELRREIAFVFQETVLFSGKISDNIAYGNPDVSLEDIQQAADMARVGDFISTLPDGYDTNLSQMATNLSGGQRQRVAIARALASGARIIVFDDSTSALDARTEAAVMKAINDRLKCTKIIIAQKISSVVNSDRIYLLEAGRVVERGTHGELMKTSDLYRDIYRSQFGEVGEESA